ncbi:MAG: hypothetical protein QNJ22_11795 [Desulfosarcinaceae bacterium]|nr:hypothetical protein [Desulfosarcinaceae bacterium]
MGYDGEKKFCLCNLAEEDEKQGVLAIQKAFREYKLRSKASMFQQAIEYIDRETVTSELFNISSMPDIIFPAAKPSVAHKKTQRTRW